MVKIKSIGKILQELLHDRRIYTNKIVVFGSYAEGKTKRDSDIDIIIVSKSFRNRSIFDRVNLTKGIHRELVRKTRKPFDIMYYSDIEWKGGNSLIINAAKKKGEIIYG